MKTIHMIGVGGSGMSALAKIYLEKGYKVSGSDKFEGRIIEGLKKRGLKFYAGHGEGRIPKGCGLVVYSRAVGAGNVERKEARKKGVRALPYFGALGEELKGENLVAVTGTHGKTTVTAMLGLAMIATGEDPTIVVGANLSQLGGENVRIGKGGVTVVEACEYERNFLALRPRVMVVTTLEYDHADTYKTKGSYVEAFCKLAKRLPKDGWLVIPRGVKEAERLAECTRAKVARFGEADLPEEVKLQVPGKHNRANGGAVWRLMLERGVEMERVKEGLVSYKGAGRRFEMLGKKGGRVFVSDYAHHPTEVRATLEAAKEEFRNAKVTAVFQPHQFSRTRVFLKEFGKAFDRADKVVISEIYEARDKEEDKRRVSGKKLAREVGKSHVEVHYGGGLAETTEMLKKITEKGEVVILMGAGDVPEIFELW